jgi:hypothetical protein
MAKQTLTVQDVINFLHTRPRYDDVTEISNLLEEYLRDIDGACEDWMELLPICPDGKEWGNKHRRDKFHTVVNFLQRQGFIVGDPELLNTEEDPDGCRWRLTNNEKEVARLEWKWSQPNCFVVSGCPIPRDSEGKPIVLPSSLSWV